MFAWRGNRSKSWTDGATYVAWTVTSALISSLAVCNFDPCSGSKTCGRTAIRIVNSGHVDEKGVSLTEPCRSGPTALTTRCAFMMPGILLDRLVRGNLILHASSRRPFGSNPMEKR